MRRCLHGFMQPATAFVEMPDNRFDLMIGFLRQNGGRFSHRARMREFEQLTDEEAAAIEAIYQDQLLEAEPGATSRI